MKMIFEATEMAMRLTDLMNCEYRKCLGINESAISGNESKPVNHGRCGKESVNGILVRKINRTALYRYFLIEDSLSQRELLKESPDGLFWISLHNYPPFFNKQEDFPGTDRGKPEFI